MGTWPPLASMEIQTAWRTVKPICRFLRAMGSLKGWVEGHPRWRLARCLVGLLALISLGFPVRGMEEADRKQTFRRACEQFDRAKAPADYLEAARLFESLLGPDFQSGEVLYNLGNAYFKAGDLGRSIAAYRKAQRLRPRDPYLADNLNTALDAAAVPVFSTAREWWKWVFFWHDALAQFERQTLCLGAWILAFLLALGKLFRPSRALKWALAVFLALALLSTLGAGLGYYQEVVIRRGVVVSETVGRKGYGESNAPAFLEPLKPGSEFFHLETLNDWAHINFPGKGDAWVPARSVTLY